MSTWTRGWLFIALLLGAVPGCGEPVVAPEWKWSQGPVSAFTATLLPSGKVLLLGGSASQGYASLYDPEADILSSTGAPAEQRRGPSVTVLPSGKVLVAGGVSNNVHLTSAELYDPDTGTWTVTGSMAHGRASHSATLLPSGLVLVAGGSSPLILTSGNTLSSTELYDPETGTWSSTGSMAQHRAAHPAFLLPSGRVAVIAGYTGATVPKGPNPSNLVEEYDPNSGTWTATSFPGAEFHSADMLPSGKVISTGGISGWGGPSSSVALYDPDTRSGTILAPMNHPRSRHTTTVLPSGKVLVVGGYGQPCAELYDPATETWSLLPCLSMGPSGHTALRLPSGKVLLVGGNLESALVFVPGSGT